MSEVRRIYRLNSSTPEDINFILSLIGDRLDQLEGLRDTPSSTDTGKVRVYAEDDASTLLHGFGDLI